jgi:hypothetical protein
MDKNLYKNHIPIKILANSKKKKKKTPKKPKNKSKTKKEKNQQFFNSVCKHIKIEILTL